MNNTVTLTHDPEMSNPVPDQCVVGMKACQKGGGTVDECNAVHGQCMEGRKTAEFSQKYNVGLAEAACYRVCDNVDGTCATTCGDFALRLKQYPQAEPYSSFSGVGVMIGPANNGIPQSSAGVHLAGADPRPGTLFR
jgi:hypothetical protein